MKFKINSFSIFGKGRESYINGLSIILRQHYSLYTDNSWKIHISLDEELTNSGYSKVIKHLHKEGLLDITVIPKENMIYQKRLKCIMMLWRMLPIWNENNEYVFCRDLDSILTPRQLQCVLHFIQLGKTVHGINDNPCHHIPLMGGMCGFKTDEFISLIKKNSLEQLLHQNNYSDEVWDTHGTDQYFLMKYVWPIVKNESFIDVLNGKNDRGTDKYIYDIDCNVDKNIMNYGDDFTSYIGASTCTTDVRSYSSKEIIDFYNKYGSPICDIISKIEKSYNFNI